MLPLIITLAVIGAIVQGLFIYFEHKEKYTLAVILKGTASLFFVAIGLVAIIKYGMHNLIFIGLILGLFGDVLLNLRFVFTKIGSKIFLIGVLSFLIGHIIYLTAVETASNFLIPCIIIGVVLAAIILFIIFKLLDVKLSYKIFGILYIGTISVMTALSIGRMIYIPSSAATIFGIGAIMFLISDVVLIFNSFGKNPKFSLRITNLTFYYIGQILIAISLFY